MANKRSKELGYAITGLGLGILGYYVWKKRISNTTSTNTTVSSTSTPSSSSNSANTTSTSTPSTGSSSSNECTVITPNNFSQQLLVNCFGGSLTQCGLYQPLTTISGFCEAYSTSMNSSITTPKIQSGLIFYNSTSEFFGFYWSYPGQYGGVSPCYCQGDKQIFPSNQTGAFFDWIGLILPGYYTWLPTYYFPSTGIGFLTYKGALWYSPATYGLLGYLKNNNTTYTVNLNNTPDGLGYTTQQYTTDVGGSLCFYYPDFNSGFCLPIAPNQTVPFWAGENTTVKWCPSTSAPNCTTVYG